MLVLALLLGGCAFMVDNLDLPAPPPAPPEPEIAVVEPRPAEPPSPPPAKAAPPATKTPLRTAVVLSQDIPALTAIAEEIERRIGAEQLSIYNLQGRPANAASVKAALQTAPPDRLIAIGLLAATLGRELPDTPMVFCQVYNYGDHDLLSPSSKGVNMLPPFEQQLSVWKQVSPRLKRVGIITGPGQDALLDEIRVATAQHDVELMVRTVSSDQEALFNFKRLTPEIQGLWLLPDNRILSPEVVREIMSYSAKYRKQVVVFGSNLLGLGALMSVVSDAADVADRVLSRFDHIGSDARLSGPDMLPLTRVRTTINHDVAEVLGLATPDRLADSGRID